MPLRELHAIAAVRHTHPQDADGAAPTVLDARRRPPAFEQELTARAAVEARAGRTFSDPEWGRARARLVQFASILRAWHREATAGESELRKAA